jgi:hypothetical protein
MVDPNWFPSAVMQTVGALYGIFIAFFVLVLQRLDKNQITGPYANSAKMFDKKIDYFETLFKVLTYIIVFTEIFNAGLVYCVSDSIYARYDNLLFISFLTFLVAVVYIAGFSYYLTSFLSSVIKKSPDYETPNDDIFKKISTFDFNRVIIYFAWLTLIVISFVYFHKKHGVLFEITVFYLFIIALPIIIIYQFHDKKKNKPKK